MLSLFNNSNNKDLIINYNIYIYIYTYIITQPYTYISLKYI